MVTKEEFINKYGDKLVRHFVCSNGVDVFVGYERGWMFLVTCPHEPHGVKYDSRFEYKIRDLNSESASASYATGYNVAYSFSSLGDVS